MKIPEKIWKWLDGNKTIICAAIWILVSNGIIKVSPDIMPFIEWILGILTGGAFLHHAKKGFFTVKKGD